MNRLCTFCLLTSFLCLSITSSFCLTLSSCPGAASLGQRESDYVTVLENQGISHAEILRRLTDFRQREATQLNGCAPPAKQFPAGPEKSDDAAPAAGVSSLAALDLREDSIFADRATPSAPPAAGKSIERGSAGPSTAPVETNPARTTSSGDAGDYTRGQQFFSSFIGGVNQSGFSSQVNNTSAFLSGFFHTAYTRDTSQQRYGMAMWGRVRLLSAPQQSPLNITSIFTNPAGQITQTSLSKVGQVVDYTIGGELNLAQLPRFLYDRCLREGQEEQEQPERRLTQASQRWGWYAIEQQNAGLDQDHPYRQLWRDNTPGPEHDPIYLACAAAKHS
jgi:hypothetical protein